MHQMLTRIMWQCRHWSVYRSYRLLPRDHPPTHLSALSYAALCSCAALRRIIQLAPTRRTARTPCPPHRTWLATPHHYRTRSRTTAAQNAPPRARKTHQTHPKNQAYRPQNYSTSTDVFSHSYHGAANFETRCGGARTRFAHPDGAPHLAPGAGLS